MEISGVVCRQIPCLHAAKPKSADVCGVVNRQVPYSSSSAVFDLRYRRVPFKSGRLGLRMVSGFSDEEHLRYYYDVPRCGVRKDREKIRRNLKLLEGFSKDLSAISQNGSVLDPVDDLAARFPTKPLIEVDEILEKLSQMSAEVKELKIKKKQEKAEVKELKIKKKQERAEEKVSHMQTILDSDSSSSSSSSSSDSECDEVINMSSLRTEARMPAVPQEFQASHSGKKITSALIMPTNQQQNIDQDFSTGTNEKDGNGSLTQDDGIIASSGALTKRIEVCMGKSCSKSGAASLLKEFERVVDIQGAVSGCKCMGKCKNGPNVRVTDCASGVSCLGSDSVRTPTNTSFVGVGLEDVGVIVANTFGQGKKDSGFRSEIRS